MTHTSGTESLQNGSNQYLRHFFYNVVSYIWYWDHNSSFKSRNCQMSDPLGINRAGWRNDPGTPPREVCFPKELVAPPWAQQNSMKSAFLLSCQWLPQPYASYFCSQKIFSQVNSIVLFLWVKNAVSVSEVFQMRDQLWLSFFISPQ